MDAPRLHDDALFLVGCLDQQTYVIADAFRSRGEAQRLAETLPSFVVLCVTPPTPETGPYLCQLQDQGMRVIPLRPSMGAIAILRRVGPLEIIWAADEGAAAGYAQAQLGPRSWLDMPSFARSPKP